MTPSLVLDCRTIHAATFLLTNEVWAPVSNRVAAEYDELSFHGGLYTSGVLGVEAGSGRAIAPSIVPGCVPGTGA